MMSTLKEIKGFDKKTNEIMRYSSLPEISVSLDQVHIINLVDQDGDLYVYKLIKKPVKDKLNDAICEVISVDINDIKELFSILTDDQRNIVMHIYYVYKKIMLQKNLDKVCEDNPRIILQGAAGTGKSTVINFIEKLVTWEENKIYESPQKLKVIKCAFTGKAAANIEGMTLNSLFSIPIYNTRSLRGKKLEDRQQKLDNCIFFICDEISMVGETLMTSVNNRLKQIFDNDKLYGDRFVLLVGDLYQIEPVLQTSLFPKSVLWKCCEFYELTKIIRQQDENFINALNHFRDSRMTDEDGALLRSRFISDINQVPDSVIHLFYKNKHVDEFNIEKLNQSNEEEETVNVIDMDENVNNWHPSNLRVKIGMRYMITCNLDVGDGLANGTTGVVKGFDKNEIGEVTVVWMQFYSNRTGKKARSKYFKKTIKTGFENLVPIHRAKFPLKLNTDRKVKTKQFPNIFPLTTAEAVTVHKSQGQTYHEGVCVHITKDKNDQLRTHKGLQYVALTRVTRLEDLYLHITAPNFDFSKTKDKIFTKKKNELNRLRKEKKLKLAFETFEDKKGDVIMYLNTELTFAEHYQFVTADKWYGNGSLLIFTETNTIGTDKIEIPNFEIAFRSDMETDLRSCGGIICYKEASKSVEVVDSVSDNKNKFYLSLLLYEKYLYIVTGVKGDSDNDDFRSAIDKFIVQYIQDKSCILMIGNFDCNAMSWTDFLEGLSVGKTSPCDILETNEESPNDMVMTLNIDIPRDQYGFYEYFPSSHKPIYVMVPTKDELMGGYREDPADYRKPGTSQYTLPEAMEVE